MCTKGWGHILQHALVHILVLNEVADGCIHRIEYLKKYKKLLETNIATWGKIKFSKLHKTENRKCLFQKGSASHRPFSG